MSNEPTNNIGSERRTVASLRGMDPLIGAVAASATGALIASLLPGTNPERRWLGHLGARFNAAATAVSVSAWRAIKAELSTVPLTSAAASAQVERVLDQIVHPE